MLCLDFGGGLLGDVEHIDDLWVIQQRSLPQVQGSGLLPLSQSSWTQKFGEPGLFPAAHAF